MKKKLFFVLSFCLCFMLVLTGCGGALLAGGPAATDTVYGNGTLAVMKGD